ncbi:zonadhesin-like [Takifugu rubripes]|uniref:zonadhesin-like n=1 Tax=Takifugu rubripes TaxID=31033 RepID=UPI00114600E3|nr:zonadhesin-like [Takifugu rubripes]
MLAGLRGGLAATAALLVLTLTGSRCRAEDVHPSLKDSVCPVNCNFENDLCGWEQLIQDSFDWTRHSGPTPSDLTGPDQDHTTGAGFYMYIEGNSVTHGDSARLLSSSCLYNGPLCLEFWYHMFGSATAMALNIYLLKDNRATKVWSAKNNRGPMWHQAQIDIGATAPFKIIVEAIRGSNAESDVAIDDISIHAGSCTGFPAMAVESWLPTTPADVPPSRLVCNAECNFDRHLCSWSQTVTDAFDWTWQSGSTPTPMTGPSADHTGGGRYLYIEASSVTHGDTARLISAECSNSGPKCLQFWYHMYGSADTMGLHVYLVQNNLARNVWRMTNDQGNMWRLAEVELTTTGVFQIIFEGRRGSNEESDVAIDDVKLYHGECADLNKPTPAATTSMPTSTEATVEPTIATTSAQPETTTGATQPLTTAEPATTGATQAQTTAEPATTAEPTTTGTGTPRPPTTAEPATTAEPTTTGAPHPPTTARPPTTAEPVTTAEPTTTGAPRPPTTAEPATTAEPTTTGAPRPPTTAEPATTAPLCPPNSHYSPCVPACTPTCTHLNGPPHCVQIEACNPGCVCNDGFVQKGSVCVPIGQCGCVDENGHKHQFDEEWYTSHCRQKCECEEEDGVGEIECDDEDGCDDDAVCLPNQEGDYYCQPTGFGDCTMTRDSKYSTFDELKYGFEGEHSYVLVRSKNLPQNFQDVYVEGIYAQIHDGDDSSEEERDRRDSDEDDDEEEDSNEQDGRHRLRELKIRVYNHTVEFKKNRGLVVDGRNIKPPVSPSAGLKIYQRSSRIYLKSDFGLLVKFDGHGAAEITLPRIYRRKVGGLCGNFDQQRHNDWMKPDGTLARNVREFGASWRV